jgi:Na+-driven multidrug efflux pump
MGVSVVVTFAVRANGAVVAPLLILIFSAVIVRFSIGFGLYERFGADAIWAAFIATSIASCVLSIAYYLNGSWKKAKAMPTMNASPLQTAPE